MMKHATRGDAGAFIACLADPAEFRPLIDTLTVRETFFYRFAAQFDAFRDHLLPQFLARAAGEERRVRVWSAGCCTGDEPYTLAIIAAEQGCLDRIEILATDINESYLEAAMAGVFSTRSVAQLPAPLRQRYFTASGGRFTIDPAIRARVTFKWLNLADAVYPSVLNGTAGVDLIFCRNVLIYFDKLRIAVIIDSFAECLNDGGVVALGHSEVLPPEWTLAVQPIGDAFFYRRPAGREPDEVDRPIEPPFSRLASAIPPPPAPNAEATTLLDEAERLANHGRSSEAAAMCRRAIQLDASQVRGHYLLGVFSLDDPFNAHRCFRRAVDLNPAHLPARLHLAECADKMGRAAEAVVEYRQLERLARAWPPDEVLDSLEGITYGMLALIGQSALRRLG